MIRVDRSLAARYLIALLAAACTGLGYLMLSERTGRLAMDLQYDDVSYALDAASRLDALRVHGWEGLLRDLVASPPHSPYSTGIGLASFLLLGEHDLSLYLSNLWILIGAAFLVAWVTRNEDSRAFGIGLAFVLGSALAYRSQTEFRPDCAYGLTIAAAVVVFSGAVFEGDSRRIRVSGLLFGLALLIKPTFFPHTLLLAGTLHLLAIVGRPLVAGHREWLVDWREIAMHFGILVAVAIPYYVVAGKPIFTYFWANTFGLHAQIHTLDQFSPGQLWIVFRPLIERLAGSHIAASMVATAAVAVWLTWRGLTTDALRLVFIGMPGLISLGVIVAGRQPSLYFFASAAWLLMFAMVIAIGPFLRSMRRPWSSAWAVVAVVSVFPLTLGSLKAAQDEWFEGAFHGRSFNVRAVGAIRDDLRRCGLDARSTTMKLLVDSSGPVNTLTLRWVARLHGMRMIGDEIPFIDELASVLEMAYDSDYVVLIRPNQTSLDKWLPIHKIQEPLLAALSNDHRFQSILNGESGTYVALANRARLKASCATSSTR